MTQVLVRSGAMLLGGADGVLGGGTDGYFVGDTRMLSRWELTVDGSRLEIGAVTEDVDRRRLVLLPATTRGAPAPFVVVRTQAVEAGGYSERVEVRSTVPEAARLTLRLRVGSDFADQFALRSDRVSFDLSGAVRTATATGAGLLLRYRHEHDGVEWSCGVAVSADPHPDTRAGQPGDLAAGELTWTLDLPGHGVTGLTISAAPDGATPVLGPATGPGGAGTPHDAAPRPPSPARAARLRARSLADLDALVMPCPGHPQLRVPAAGVPWFLTLFGRDSLLTALLAQDEQPHLLPDVVQAMIAFQGRVEDPHRGEQPGRVVHEVRSGELASLGLVPYGRYYGTVDATALFLIALGRLGDADALDRAEGAARAAVRWLRTFGGLDEHGFVRYEPDPRGLIHQGWKDSADAVVHPDGRPAAGAIALSEVQGYTWRALREAARLARGRWRDPAWADELEALAAGLAGRFRERFWSGGFPVLALDGTGEQVRVLASNAGHLLWSGMLTPAEATSVAHRLLAEDFFTGWGIRTVAAGERGYSPTSYHNGSVWPHDTMLAAAGMRAYGLDDEARQLAVGLLDAAGHFADRLPELFVGLGPREVPVPARYPHAAAPQAWAAAAGLVAARLAR